MVEGKNWSETSNKAFSPLGAFSPPPAIFFSDKKDHQRTRDRGKKKNSKIFLTNLFPASKHPLHFGRIGSLSTFNFIFFARSAKTVHFRTLAKNNTKRSPPTFQYFLLQISKRVEGVPLHCFDSVKSKLYNKSQVLQIQCSLSLKIFV